MQSQQIPSDLVRSTVEVAASERLALIQQRLTTRSNLLAMADRLTLFDDKPGFSRTEIVDALRAAIEVEEIVLAGGRRRGEALAAAFTVTFKSRSPVTAARVANELVTMVLQENLETRAARASQTREFLQKKSEDLAVELGRIESEVAEFKTSNSASLPDSLTTRQAELLSLQQRLFELEGQRVGLEERRRALQDAIVSGAPVDITAAQLTPEQRQLQQLQQQLAQARGIYSNSHPTIRSLRSSIASLEAAIAAGGSSTGNAGQNSAGMNARLLKDQQQRALDLTNRQLELLARQINEATTRSASLKTSIEATPDTEIALTSMLRKREDLANQHQIAARKYTAAADGEELEINRQAERYEIIEQAQIPEEPDSPPRKLISIAGFGGSIVIGMLLMVVFELTNRTIRTTRNLVSQVGIAPIVAIPMIRTTQESAQRRITSGVYVLLLIALGAGILFLIDQYVAPLDRLTTKIMDDAHLTPIVDDARERFAGIQERIFAWLRSAIGGGA